MQKIAVDVAPGLAHGPSSEACRTLGRRVRRAALRMGYLPKTLPEIGVRVVDDRAIAKMHQQFMGESGPTDVLSFPAEGTPGDIVLSWDAVRRQARDSGSAALLDEATVLCVHGLAHLLGHDHRSRAQGRKMHNVERHALKAVGVQDIVRPYAPSS